MVTNATLSPRSGNTETPSPWHVVVRVAVATTLVMMALAYALHTYVRLSDGLTVTVVASLGLLVGFRLPAAQPPIPHWLLDEDEWTNADWATN